MTGRPAVPRPHHIPGGVGVAVIGCGTIGTLRAHYAPALAALRAGKHVLAEKPGMVPG